MTVTEAGHGLCSDSPGWDLHKGGGQDWESDLLRTDSTDTGGDVDRVSGTEVFRKINLVIVLLRMARKSLYWLC